jgi:hypothetical protein
MYAHVRFRRKTQLYRGNYPYEYSLVTRDFRLQRYNTSEVISAVSSRIEIRKMNKGIEELF